VDLAWLVISDSHKDTAIKMETKVFGTRQLLILVLELIVVLNLISVMLIGILLALDLPPPVLAWLDGTARQLDLVSKMVHMDTGMTQSLALVKLSIVALILMTTPITLKPKLVHHLLALVYSDGTDLLKDLVFKMDLSHIGIAQLQTLLVKLFTVAAFLLILMLNSTKLKLVHHQLVLVWSDGTDLQLDLVFKTDLLVFGIAPLLIIVKLSIVALTLMTTPIIPKLKLVHHHLVHV